MKKLEQIALYAFEQNDAKVSLLQADELKNLSIERGNLTKEERCKIEEHAALSKEMLEHLPFPKKIRRCFSYRNKSSRKVK